MGPLGWIGLIVVGIALHWTINLTFTSNPTLQGSQSQFGTNSLTQYVLYVGAWLLIIIGIVWPATVISHGFGVVSLLILGMIVHLHRQRESQALLWLLGMAMENGIPISRMARAFGQERCDELGTRANHLAKMIESGVSLPDALDAMRYRLPAHAQLAVDMDAAMPETGKLLHATARQRLNVDSDVHPQMHQLFYFANLVLVTVVAFTFLAVKVMPVFRQIMIDFDVPMNAAMGSALNGTQIFSSYVWVAIVLWIIANVFLVVFIFHYLGWIRWEPFFVRSITRRHHASVILQSLASQVRTNRPIHTSLELMSEKYPQRHIRNRLSLAATRIRRGHPWQDALHTEQLIRQCDANLMKAAERAGNLPWALEEIGLGIARRMKYRLTLWMRLIMPLLIIALAAVIGLMGVGVFSCLRDLVLSISM